MIGNYILENFLVEVPKSKLKKLGENPIRDLQEILH